MFIAPGFDGVDWPNWSHKELGLRLEEARPHVVGRILAEQALLHAVVRGSGGMLTAEVASKWANEWLRNRIVGMPDGDDTDAVMAAVQKHIENVLKGIR